MMLICWILAPCPHYRLLVIFDRLESLINTEGGGEPARIGTLLSSSPSSPSPALLSPSLHSSLSMSEYPSPRAMVREGTLQENISLVVKGLTRLVSMSDSSLSDMQQFNVQEFQRLLRTVTQALQATVEKLPPAWRPPILDALEKFLQCAASLVSLAQQYSAEYALTSSLLMMMTVRLTPACNRTCTRTDEAKRKSIFQTAFAGRIQWTSTFRALLVRLREAVDAVQV